MRKKHNVLSVVLLLAVFACTDSPMVPVSKGHVDLKMMLISSAGNNLSGGRSMAKTITLDTFMISIREIHFILGDKKGHHDSDSTEDDHHHQDSGDGDHHVDSGDTDHHSDSTDVDKDDENDDEGENEEGDSTFTDEVKLKGPFLVDLLDSGSTAQLIASVDLPNGKYRGVKFHMHKVIESGSIMNGKSILIKGKFNDHSFEIWDDTQKQIKICFPDSAGLVVDKTTIGLIVKIEVDRLLEKLKGGIDLSSAKDGNQNGVIEINPHDEDGNRELARAIDWLLSKIGHLEKEHDD
jgi:hypothetical protein